MQIRKENAAGGISPSRIKLVMLFFHIPCVQEKIFNFFSETLFFCPGFVTVAVLLYGCSQETRKQKTPKETKIMKTTITKITATVLAILTVLFTFCITSFAAEGGGADVCIDGKTSHYDDIAQAWQAVATSKGTAEITLQEDWKADENGSFGEGDGFYGGGLYVYCRSGDLTVDLNGYSIDRGLTEAKEGGYVFHIRNSTTVYITNKSGKNTSTVTGANAIDCAGAFSVIGSTVHISNINITNNVSDYKGGAMFIMTGPSFAGDLKAEVSITGCNITGNKAKTGGAIFVYEGCTLRIYDTVITKNEAAYDAGIHAEVTAFDVCYVYLGGTVVIADNIAENDGTGLTLDESFLTKAYVRYDKKMPLNEDSRIVVLSKTGDKTLRITADSSKSYIGCYTYENDSYKIVEKGSGNSKYLDIKKN